MKVTSLDVSNLFSFADFSLRFQDGLTVIVGPNGAGKSNVVRALDAVGKLLDWADDQSRPPGTVPRVPAGSVVSSYAQASHDGSPADTPIELRLGIQLTTGPERERVVSFFRAALLATLCQESAHATDDTLKGALSSWVMREIDETKLTALFTRTLVFRHAGYETALWEARYEFCHDGRRFEWLLYSFSSWDSIIPPAQDAAAVPAASSTRLCQVLFDQPTTPLPLPDPLPSFDLAKLCLPPGGRLAGLSVSMGTGVFNDRYEPFRKVAGVLELPETTGQTSYGFARALR